MIHSLFITCPRDIESLLEEEAADLGLTETRQTLGGVSGKADMETIYKLCLWSRLGNRVLMRLFEGEADEKDKIHQLCFEYDWAGLLNPDTTLAVNFSGQSESIRNAMFGALCVKDAIVDKLRQQTGQRPNIDTAHPDCIVVARLHHRQLQVYYDLSGHSLHQRGYRDQAGIAPLKENLAAALLYRAGWKEFLKEQKPMIDPCCGSGTILIEAAMMATDRAPGLDREDYGFKNWRGHDEAFWKSLKHNAFERNRVARKKPLSKLNGYDIDMRVIKTARINCQNAGFENLIKFEKRAFTEFTLPEECRDTSGLIICNPPYGERLNDSPDLLPLYQQLGLALTRHCQNWRAAVLTSDKVLAKATGLRSNKQYAFYNGNIACKLYLFDLSSENKSALTTIPVRAEMIFNRLVKNLKNLKKWREQNQIHCYRVYDADMPEYAFAIDIYEDWAHVQEYAAPANIEPEKVEKRMFDVMHVLPQALGIASDHVVLKQRKRQKGKQQYEKQAQTRHNLIVQEGSAKFLVNLKDYLDTGLFLDHRLLRLKFFEMARGKEFLNLFCYTATASVHAALGGAKTTVNVDMSHTYLDWAEENFRLNGLNLQRHEFIQADCLLWLDQCSRKFDIIFLDPPSFSNSKRMDQTLDIQRDHQVLISRAMNLLKPDGQLFFSTNLRKFRLDTDIEEKFSVTDISLETLDRDYGRNPHIHRCYRIVYPAEEYSHNTGKLMCYDYRPTGRS